jgi:Uma2 family endonuclease
MITGGGTATMADRARQLMTIADFLAWDDGTDTRYELVHGVPVAMAPPGKVHNQIAQSVSEVISAAVRGQRPCRAVQQPGLAIPGSYAGHVLVPDVIMTCEPVDDGRLFESPRLIVEVLSPSTQGFDKTTKLAIYGGLPSVEEIWLLSSRRRAVLLYERREGSWHAGLPHIGRAAFDSRVLGCSITLDEIYALTPLAEVDEDGL